MKPEKQLMVEALGQKIKGSPYLLVTDYTGLTVSQFSELRKRLRGARAEMHVTKNTLLHHAMTSAGLPQANGAMTGMTAVVTGVMDSDICAAAKVVKDFKKEFEKPKFKLGVMARDMLGADQVEALAELPPLPSLRASLLGLLQAPATRVATVLGAPAGQLARVIKAYADKQGGEAPAGAAAA
jgi:large subunit ribosomal protein L10